VSTSIRPPGSGPGSVGLGSIETPEAASGAGGVTETGGTQRAASTGAAGSVNAAGTPQAGSTGETNAASWIRRLEAGEVTRAEAIEGLVAQAVERQGGARLPAHLRNELADVLRAALLEDPVLGRLLEPRSP
jgi:hypothetical protein